MNPDRLEHRLLPRHREVGQPLLEGDQADPDRRRLVPDVLELVLVREHRRGCPLGLPQRRPERCRVVDLVEQEVDDPAAGQPALGVPVSLALTPSWEWTFDPGVSLRTPNPGQPCQDNGVLSLTTPAT